MNFASFWQTLSAIAWKELVQLGRARRFIRTFLVLQLVDVVAIAWIDTVVRDMPMVIVDQDHTAESRQLAARLAATHTFKPKYVTSSTEQARGHIRAGRAKIAVVIPPDYGRLRAAGSGAHFLTLVDGSDAMASAQATAAIDGVAVQMNVESARIIEAPRVEVARMFLFNPDASVARFMLPGLLALVLLNYYSARALSLATEREEGNLERLLMTPINHFGLIVGKLVPYFVAAMINAVIFLLFVRWVFEVPIQGSIVLLLVSIALYILSFLTVCNAIAAAASTNFEAFMTLLTFTLPSELLSGYFFPIASLPAWLRPVAYALPETHFIEIMRGICLRGAGLPELLPHLLFLAFMSVGATIVAKIRFERSIAG
jgi:ABC-2 type transport system permease protein